MTENALFDENLTAEFGLEHIIRTRLMGVDPDEQDVKLDDADWQNILDMIAALKAALPQLQDNARFLRDIQASAGKVIDAFDAAKAVENVLVRVEARK